MELNCFSLAILILIFLNTRSHINRYLLDQKLFLALLYTTALILVLDMLMWLLDGMPGRAMHAAYTAVTICYYTLNPLICALWYLYTDYYINRSRARLEKIIVPLLIPLCAVLVLAIMSSSGNVLFFIDGNNIYHRGRLFLAMAAVSFFFLAYTLIFTILNRRRVQAKEYSTLLFFPIPPIVGGIIQTLFYGVSLIWVCTTISLLLLFINFQNDELHTDHLTGLYNRRQLDNYLRTKSQSSGGRAIAGLMIDLNSFKEINDAYGHNSGDQALKYVADILKKTFRKNDFVARYGGDEFVVIMEINEKTDLDTAVGRLNENVQQFNSQKLIPYEISLSVGYDYYSSEEKNFMDFLTHIDGLMYTDKRKSKTAGADLPKA